MAKKDYLYNDAKKYVKDKDTAITAFIQNALNKTQQIFSYTGLPDTLPQAELEYMLHTKGHCIITEHDGELYALRGGFSGVPDAYDKPTQYTVCNPALNINRTYDIGKDCVLVKNDYLGVGLMPIIMKYGVLLIDGEISLNTAAVLSRMSMMISAPDDRTKASADLFIQKMMDGDYCVVGENAFFDGVKMQTPSNGWGSHVTPLIELIQYYRATFLNEIGLQANYNMKRERLIPDETAMAIDTLLPLIDSMYTERIRALSAVNDMFGYDIQMDYNSAWKVTHEHRDREYETVESPTGDAIEVVELSAYAENEQAADGEKSDENNIEKSDKNDNIDVDETADETPADDSADKEDEDENVKSA